MSIHISVSSQCEQALYKSVVIARHDIANRAREFTFSVPVIHLLRGFNLAHLDSTGYEAVEGIYG